jgi:hypothetical protein
MEVERLVLLEALKAELKFLESGGYRPDTRVHWRPKLMFQDSPTCLNFDSAHLRKPCSECVLVRFVPEGLQSKKIPCRYIPLDEQGQTVDSFYSSGTQEELEIVVAQWLKNTIARLERETSENFRDTERPEVHVRTKFVSGR